MSYYPPGVGGAYNTEIGFECRNEDCDTDHFEADAITELGMTYLRDEDSGDLCPKCGKPGVES